MKGAFRQSRKKPIGSPVTCVAMIEIPTTPPSVKWFGIKNACNPRVATAAPDAILALRLTIFPISRCAITASLFLAF